MSETLKGFGWVLLILGAFVAIMSYFSRSEFGFYIGIVGFGVSFSLLIYAGFAKMLEDTRDTLNRIEKILENQNKTEE